MFDDAVRALILRAEPAGETGDTASITLLSALLVPGDTFTAEESVCRTSPPPGDPAKKAKKSAAPPMSSVAVVATKNKTATPSHVTVTTRAS